MLEELTLLVFSTVTFPVDFLNELCWLTWIMLITVLPTLELQITSLE
jgi:hypothetical protein